MAKPVLKIEYMPLGELLAAPRNPKAHNLPGLESSIQEHGFTQPMVINERTGLLVEGHGRLDALQRLKQSGAAAPLRIVDQQGDWYVPVVRGVSFETDEQAEKYLIGANQLVSSGGWDDSLLTTMLQDLSTAGEALESIGFDQAQLDTMLSGFQTAQGSLPQVTVAPAPAPSTAEPVPTADGTGVAPAPAPSTAAPVPIADGTGVAPAPAAPAPAAPAPAAPAPAAPVPEPAEDMGILDPLNRELTRGENSGNGEIVRFMRYSIPLTVDESAALVEAVEDWVHQTGGLYGFFNHILKG